MFSGVGLGVFLYIVGHSVVLNLSPDQISKIPFDLYSLLHVMWLVGLIPALAGFGKVMAGLSIRRDRPTEIRTPDEQPLRIGEPAENTFVSPTHFAAPHAKDATVFAARQPPESVTDRTTNILEHQPQPRQTDEIR
jgi:hypothetical protein